MADQSPNLQDIIREVVSSLSYLPAANTESPRESPGERNECVQGELYRSFQLPRGPRPGVLHVGSGTDVTSCAPHSGSLNQCSPSVPSNSSGSIPLPSAVALQAIAAGFSSRRNYSARQNGSNKKDRQPRSQRNASGRFAPYKTSQKKQKEAVIIHKDVCLLPGPSWDEVPRRKLKEKLVNKKMYVDACPIPKDWSEADLRKKIYDLFLPVLYDTEGNEIRLVNYCLLFVS